MFTLRQLVQKCPPVQFDKAKQVHVLKAVADIAPNNCVRLRAVVQRVSENGKHDQHQIEIQSAVPGDSIYEGQGVRVWCDCGFHVYTGQEYLLTHKDSSTIVYGIDAAPDIRNPQRRIMLCHHLLRGAMMAFKQKV